MIDSDCWSPAGGIKLEPNAHAAATENATSVALGAGPGAGKTEALAQRADFLLKTGLCPYPRRILAISFKIDAARNLKERVRGRCGSELAARLDSHTFHAVAKRIIDRFRPVLTGQDALNADYQIGERRIDKEIITFKDIIPLALTILNASLEARNAIRQTYSHVFLDEFQDCTGAQYDLIKACFIGTPALLTAVGDTKQSIMGWAGALDGIFLDYINDFSAQQLYLYQNFRSLPTLRRMQNAMVKVMEPSAAVPDADIFGDEGIIDILSFTDEQEEAAELAKLIRERFEKEGISYSQTAVLVARQQEQYCQPLYTALAAAGIPYREEDTNQDLATEPAARVLLDFLAIVVGDSQPDAYQRLLEVAVFNQGMSEEREYRYRSRWDRFVHETRADYRDGRIDLDREDDLAGLIEGLVATIGRPVLAALSHDYQQGQRLEEIIAETRERLLDHLARTDDAQRALASFGGEAAVRVMTIHKSKGLEFETVVLLGVEKETFWAAPSDERALFFVGASRAKNKLIVTACETRAKPLAAGRWKTSRSIHQEFHGYCKV